VIRIGTDSASGYTGIRRLVNVITF